MEPTWHSPESWSKDGTTISDAHTLKTKAWTSTLTATEVHNGQHTQVIIKAFNPPSAAADAVDEISRIAAEHDKFLASAKLQYSLTQPAPGTPLPAPAHAWVKILRLADDPPSFAMEKCGPSAQDLLDGKFPLSAKDFYNLVHCILQALIELKQRAKRSHGSIKPSDVLSALPGQSPAFKLTDPAARGEEHSANDLYALGLIIFQLVEHQKYDPLNPILPVKAWSRFGARRDRWIQFCNMLLNPNGCQETLEDVRREAHRLKPVTAARFLAPVAGVLALVAVGALGYHFFLARYLHPGGGSAVANLDPAIKSAYDDARNAYRDAFGKWEALDQTPHYDHAKSKAAYKDARAKIIDSSKLTDEASYKSAADAYKQATTQMNQALQLANDEELAGQKDDQALLKDLLAAQTQYDIAKKTWDIAASNFTANHDHTRSTAQAQAATMPAAPAKPDPATASALAAQYRQAAVKLNQALALSSDEEKTGSQQDDAKTAFDSARIAYQQALDQYTAAEKTAPPELDLSTAHMTATAARAMLPEQIVITDAAAYRTNAELYQKAAAKMLHALALIDTARKSVTQKQGDIATAVAKANQALAAQKYEDALAYYKQAADLGNAPAMHNVGLFYETGRGTKPDLAQAAAWYQKAADAGLPAAMTDLALMYETGRGVDKDYASAATWYKKAAESKNVTAMNHLGYFYENGWGVPQDYSEALNWYKQAADQNDSTATANIGVLYEKGRGVKADPVEAMKWYKKAADLGNVSAINDVGVLYDNGRGVKADPAEAMKWYKKAADQNYAPAMCNIGVLYDNGLGVPANHAEAMTWFKKAAALNHGLAMYNIGFLYESGRGVSPDIVQAVQWYRKAFKSDDDAAIQLATQALDRLGYAHQ